MRRNSLATAVGFGLFILFDIALFFWLIVHSFSKRELDDALFETQEDARPIATDLEKQAADKGSEDLFVLVSVAEETKTYIDSVLTERNLVRRVEIHDREGTVVFRQEDQDALPLEDSTSPRISFDEEPEVRLVQIPIGEEEGLGTLVIGIDEAALQQRISELRSDLIRRVSLVGGFSIALLVVGLIAFVRLQKQASQLEEQAERSERMAYVGTLASGLAHEIRSPLNSLSLNMQMLEEEARERGGSTSQRRLLSITRSELSRLEDLATGFLAYAKPSPMEVRPITLEEMISRARAVLDGELRERSVRVEVEDTSAGAEVDVDPAQINQLLLNLIHNALAAMEKTPREPLLILRARIEGSRPILEVIDNGEGVPEHVRIKMFDLFYSNRKGGTGLGLAIVQRIAEAHEARLEVESEPGEGTTLRVVFPGSGDTTTFRVPSS